ncbi:hydantoinase/oxoprolinase family protein [Mycolicibacterium porcinum]|uniref:hydantoinase/oxoprolinase family protein n=1 Tax=Mycolicibacterium porcinum TaxID=39693 RepID=UPI0011962379|nr:hydantoinase/oxoprolinase family protein [Mycolicibacterium porcinum]TVX98922.1 hydantoinase/oxoprolinase family protein [Mycolicibacterium porcinum]
MTEHVQYQIGCDIGGTFTDVTAVDSRGVVYSDKSDTTPHDLSVGLIAALENLAQRIGKPLDQVLPDTTRFVNGTTAVTNSIAELKGARVGLITTQGFGDNLLIARSARSADRDHHRQLNIPQIVPRERVVEVTERIDRKGSVVVALTDDDARAAVRRLVDMDVEAIAISLLWSFANPEHEERLAAAVAQEAPDLFVSVSSRLHPMIREYERTMTTVLNAFTGIRVAEYTGRIERELGGRGLRVPIGFMQGFGGTLTADEARQRPITLVDSGPAGGVIGAQALAKRLGIKNVVTADMGGTSFDVSVLQGNKPLVTQRVMLRDQFLTALPKIDVLPIGAGGGSIAWVDARGIPQVGPHSAGAEPGPVCYGKGGVVPTVTDASAVLGLLEPSAFLGGRRELALQPAREAMEREIGKPLDVDAVHAAAAVYRMVTANMSNAVRTVTVERGHDPRAFSMVAYGGALGIFAADIAREVGIRQVIIPADAAVFSATGLLNSDDVRTRSRSALWVGGDAATIASTLSQLDDELVATLRAAGYADEAIDVVWEGEFKYAGQQWELPVSLPRDRNLSEADLVDAQSRYGTLYEAEYGSGSAWVGSPVVLVAVRVTATGRVAALEPTPAQPVPESEQRLPATGSRTVFLPLLGEEAEVGVYDTRTAKAGHQIQGPAILEHPLTTLQIPSGWDARIDEWGNFILTDRTADQIEEKA